MHLIVASTNNGFLLESKVIFLICRRSVMFVFVVSFNSVLLDLKFFFLNATLVKIVSRLVCKSVYSLTTHYYYNIRTFFWITMVVLGSWSLPLPIIFWMQVDDTIFVLSFLWVPYCFCITAVACFCSAQAIYLFLGLAPLFFLWSYHM